MAVTLLRLIHEGRDEIYGVGSGERQRTIIVRCDHPSDNADGLYESGLLPLVGNYLDGNILMTLRPPVGIERQSKFIFKVDLRYSSRNETAQEREERLREIAPIPWMRPPTISCPVNEWHDEPLKDSTDVAICNSFGTPFATIQPRRRWSPIIRVVAPVQSIPSWYYTLAGKRNSEAVTVTRRTGALPTFAAGTLLFVPGDIPESRQSGPYIYEDLQFELHYDANEWKWEPVDMGPKYLNDDEKEADFTDGLGYLDSTGHEGNPNSPATLTFQHYETASFVDLPLNQWG
jgi:hypothetical protein